MSLWGDNLTKRFLAVSFVSWTLLFLSVNRNAKADNLCYSPSYSSSSSVSVTFNEDPTGGYTFAIYSNPPSTNFVLSNYTNQITWVQIVASLSSPSGYAIKLTPPQNFNGLGSFGWVAKDSLGNYICGKDVNVTVNPVNDAPTAAPLSVTTKEDTFVTITLPGNDIETTSSALQYTLDTTGTLGTLTLISANQYRFKPNPDYYGSTSFKYKVSDGTLTSAFATVTVKITAVNDNPVVAQMALTGSVNVGLAVQLAASDPDGPSLSFRVKNPLGGTVSAVGSDNKVIFTPSAGGQAEFTYYASDNGFTSTTTGLSNEAKVTIKVNSPPVATGAAAFTVKEDTDTTIPLGTYATDAETGVTSLEYLSAMPKNGTLSSLVNPTPTYTPKKDSNDADFFTFKAIDPSGATSDPITVPINITPVNDKPSVTSPGAALPMQEDVEADIPLFLFASDPETAAASLTYSTTKPAHGTLTNLGSSPRYKPDTDYEGTDSFNLVVTDPEGLSASPATITLDVKAVNDAPTAKSGIAALSMDEDAHPITINLADYYKDVDGPVSPSPSFTTMLPAHGKVTPLAGSTTSSTTYTPAQDYNGSDTFNFTVKDGGGVSSAPITVSITVKPVNDAPVAKDVLNVPGTENMPIQVVLPVAEDVDTNSVFTYTIVSQSHGQAVIGTDGHSVTFTADKDYDGTEAKFTYKANDGTADSNTANVTFNITGVNNVPVAANVTAAVDEDSATAILIDLSASDPEGDKITSFTLVTPPPNAKTTPTITDGKLSYQPKADFVGTDTFTYKATDARAGVSAVATGTIMVKNANNDAPILNAIPTPQTTLEDTSLTIDLKTFASDPDLDILSYAITAQTPAATADSGFTVTSEGKVTYKPPLNANGTGKATATFQVADPAGLTSVTRTVSINITAVNDVPVASDLPTLTANPGVPVTVMMQASDPDTTTLTYRVAGAINGTLGAVSGNTVTFTPTSTGTASFTYTVSDNGFASASSTSNTATATINVTTTNNKPVATGFTETFTEDASARTIVLSNHVTDETLATSLVYAATAPSHGTLSSRTVSNPSYKPNANFNGTDSFTFTAKDPGGAISSPATVSIAVSPVNDAPVAVSIPTTGNTLSGYAGKPLTVTMRGTDVDGDVLKFLPTAGSAVNGTFSGVTDTAVVFSPIAAGTSSFTYKATDDGSTTTGHVSANTATATITVVSGKPVASFSGTVVTDEDVAKAITLTATDPDVDPLTYIIVSQPTHGTLTGSDANVTYTPAENYNGTDSFIYKANDGQGDSNIVTVSVTVNPINDAPKVENVSATGKSTQDITVTFKASDVDGDALTYAAPTATANGTISGSGASRIYKSKTNYVGTETFTYNVTDGKIPSPIAAMATVAVLPLNSPPVVKSARLEMTEGDSAATVTLSAVDPDGDQLNYAIDTSQLPAKGTATLSGATLTYAPFTDAFGRDDVWFVVSDGKSASVKGLLTVSIRNVNDAPEVGDFTVTTDEDKVVTTKLVGIDKDQDKLAYYVETEEHGSSVIDGDKLTYTPDVGFNGQAKITFRASDGIAVSEKSATLTVTVNGVNTKPAAKDISIYGNEDNEIKTDLPFTDPEGDAMTYQIGTSPAHGSVSFSGNVATYVPASDYYGKDSFTVTAKDAAGLISSSAKIDVTLRAVPDPVINCSSVESADHVKTDATSGLQYYDNIITVSLNQMATVEELAEMLSVSGGATYFCSIEQTPLTPDEALCKTDSAGNHSDCAIDPVITGYGFYMIEVPPMDEAGLDVVATNLSELDYVNSASPTYLDFQSDDAPATDTEKYYTSVGSAIFNFFGIIQVQGAWEYLRKYGNLSGVKVGIFDSGVCSRPDIGCRQSNSAFSSEFGGVITAGPNNFGEMAIDGLPPDVEQPSGFPFGLIDKSSEMHGTNVAALIGSRSNDNTVEPKKRFPFIGPYNGILGGAYGLDYGLVSYVRSANVAIAGAQSTDEKFLYFTENLPNPSADVLNLSSLCQTADISNHSYGTNWAQYSNLVTSQQIRTKMAYMKSRATFIQNCPSDLFVFSAGNDGKNYDAEPGFAEVRFADKTDESGQFFPNVMHVQATELGSDVLSIYENNPIQSGSSYGSKIDIAAAGDCTSFSAPLVAGTAGLLKAVNSSLTPPQMIDIMTSTGKKTADTNTPFLDTAASVLEAIHGKNPDFVPMSTTRALYSAGAFSPTETTGSSGSWMIDGKTLTISRTSKSVFDPATGTGLANEYKWQSEANVQSTEKFELGLSSIVEDESTRVIPVMTALPKGKQTWELNGKFHTSRSQSASPALDDQATGYCFKVEYGLNAIPTTTTGAYQIPLARNSQSGLGASVTYEIKGTDPASSDPLLAKAHLSGNVVKLLLVDKTGEDAARTNRDAGYDGMSATCDVDMTAAAHDNTDNYNAWRNQLREAGEVYPTFELWRPNWNYVAGSDCGGGVACCNGQAADSKVTGPGNAHGGDGNALWMDGDSCVFCQTDHAPPQCGASAASHGVPATLNSGNADGWSCVGHTSVDTYCKYVGDYEAPSDPAHPDYDNCSDLRQNGDHAVPTKATVHFDVELGDTQCEQPADATSTSDRDVQVTDTDGTSPYYQSFDLRISGASATCTSHGTIKIRTVFEATYLPNDNEQCGQYQPFTRTFVKEDVIPADFTWSFSADKFPLTDAFTKIAGVLRTHMDRFAADPEITGSTTASPPVPIIQSTLRPFYFQSATSADAYYFLPDVLLTSKHEVPGLGVGMNVLWSHGLGPVAVPPADDPGDGTAWQVISLQKPSRAVP